MSSFFKGVVGLQGKVYLPFLRPALTNGSTVVCLPQLSPPSPNDHHSITLAAYATNAYLLFAPTFVTVWKKPWVIPREEGGGGMGGGGE